MVPTIKSLQKERDELKKELREQKEKEKLQAEIKELKAQTKKKSKGVFSAFQDFATEAHDRLDNL